MVIETYHSVGMTVPRLSRAMHALFLRYRDAVVLMAEDTYWRRFAENRRHRVVRLIPNGISPLPTADPRALKSLRARLGLPNRTTIVGSIGRLVTERRPDFLFDVFLRLAKSDPDVHLLLGGYGPMRSVLAAAADRHGIGNRVHLPGLINDPAEALALFDLYISVNVGETTGIAALEAAYAGVPVIAVQLDEDYLPTSDDWIWSSSDSDEVANHALSLLSSPNSLRDLARRQQHHAQMHHSAETMALSYERLYEEALARPGRLDRGTQSASRQC